MIAKTPTSAQLDALRVAFTRRRPLSVEDFDVAARAAKITTAAAKRAWLYGWPDENIPPLASEFPDDGVVATVRATMVATAALTRAHELGEQIDQLAPVVRRLVGKLVSGELEDPAQTREQALDALRAIVGAHRSVAVVTKAAVELDRLTRGEATAIVEHLSSSATPVDLETAKNEALALLRAVEREQAKKRLAEPEGKPDGTVH